MNLLLLLFFSDKDQSLTLSLCVLLSVTGVALNTNFMGKCTEKIDPPLFEKAGW